MNNYKLRLPLVLQYLLVSGLVVACGGGGSGSGAGGSGAASVASPGVGSGGTGISIGPITGFGSIIVNQVRYNIDGVTPSIKDATELKLGMVVQVTNAPGASTGPTGVATAVKTAAELRGELEGIVVDPAIFLSTLVVQGVSVSVDKATVYDGFISLNALSRGNFLQVYGLPQGGGGLRATRIEKISTTAQLIATGSVTNLNTSSSSFKIGSLAVNFGTSAFSGISASALANGVVLRVRGSFSAGNFIAATIEPWLDAIPNNTKISLEGLVSGYSPTAKTFTLGDVTVDISAAVFAGGDAGSLNDGDKVELLHAAHAGANHAFAGAAQDHHGMGVFVAFEGGITVGVHFEIPQLAGQRIVMKQGLAGDVLERRLAILLVWLVGDAVPAEVFSKRAEGKRGFSVHDGRFHARRRR